MKTRLYIGDSHGRFDSFNATVEAALAAASTPVDEIVSVGDFGFFPRILEGGYQVGSFDQPVRWIDGNHEDHEMIAQLAAGGSWTGKWECEHIPRGTFEDGVFFMGGATSIDRANRTQGFDWFPEENISASDFYSAMVAIDEHKGAIAVMCAHDTIQFAYHRMFSQGGKSVRKDSNAEALESIFEEARPKVFVHGHHHTSDRYKMNTSDNMHRASFVSLARSDDIRGHEPDFTKCTILIQDDGTILDW